MLDDATNRIETLARQFYHDEALRAATRIRGAEPMPWSALTGDERDAYRRRAAAANNVADLLPGASRGAPTGAAITTGRQIAEQRETANERKDAMPEQDSSAATVERIAALHESRAAAMARHIEEHGQNGCSRGLLDAATETAALVRALAGERDAWRTRALIREHAVRQAQEARDEAERLRNIVSEAASAFYDAAHSSGDPCDESNMEHSAVLYRECRAALAQEAPVDA